MWNNNNNGFSYAPRLQIIRVNGEAGARSIMMAPNSDQFLADTTNSSRIWVAQTDGAGYLTITPLDVTVHQDAPPVNLTDLEERIKHLEEQYEQFNTRSNKSTKRQQQHQSSTNEPADATN